MLTSIGIRNHYTPPRQPIFKAHGLICANETGLEELATALEARHSTVKEIGRNQATKRIKNNLQFVVTGFPDVAIEAKKAGIPAIFRAKENLKEGPVPGIHFIPLGPGSAKKVAEKIDELFPAQK